MRDRLRALIAAAAPAAALALLWGRMEEPVSLGVLLAVAALAIAPAGVRRAGLRAVVAVMVILAGLSLVFRAAPQELLPRTEGTWLGAIVGQAKDGLRGFERVALPFDPGERPEMHALVLVAVLGFGIAVALAVAARRPLLASAAVVVGGGWATASVDGGPDLALGALLLAATLWPLVVLRVRSPREGVTSAAAVLLVLTVGAGAAAAGAVPREPYLDWKSWSLVGSIGERLGVRYVWDGQYDGIRFPSRRTTVLRITADRSARYWRASTLDLFTADRWIENLYPVVLSEPSRRLPGDPLLPEAAGDPEAWVRQDVEVVRLDDDRLVSAGQPMRVESTTLSRVFVLSGGVMRVPDGIGRGERYTIWGYVPRPLPRDLVRSQPTYAAGLARYLVIDRAALPPFGEPRREAVVERLFVDDRYIAVRAYRPLWEEARRVAGGARSPYEATLAIERWLRTKGGFRYEEQPPRGQAPPLVDFVARHRAGYCQHFAGTMALMLRMLGVPSRVAVGFTSGKWKDGVWDVADRDAHAWVEAWFDGYGWVTFDPTPGRGTLTAGYTFASDSADAIRALGRGALLDVVDLGATTGTVAGASPAAAAEDGPAPARGRAAALVALGVLLALLAVVLAKLVRRRLRYVSGDPRRIALAVRRELEDVLLDQRVPVRRGASLPELRVAAERGLGVPLGALVEAVGRARFGPPERAGSAAADARRELRRVRALLRERTRPATRARGALSVRSLVVR